MLPTGILTEPRPSGSGLPQTPRNLPVWGGPSACGGLSGRLSPYHRHLPYTALLLLTTALVTTGCLVGPNYHRPDVKSPAAYRNEQPNANQTAPSLGDEKWWTVYRDEELQKLIRSAIANNYDVRIAATRVLQAQDQVALERANLYPSIGVGPTFTSERLAGFSFNLLELLASVSWTPDFWGQYRRATEAARATLLASEWNRKEILSTLVANVATAYFQMRELDLELQIARRTLGSRQQSLQLTQTLERGGAVALLDVRQAEQLVETAAESIPDTERQISQQEDLLSTLIGDNPHDIPRGMPITEQPLPREIPAGLPARLLERRPDIRAAEQQLVAANAEIGVARSMFFPSLPLTGSGGVAFGASGYGSWNVTAPFTAPIFTGGKLNANLKLSEAQEQQLLLTYRQTIQTALRQVSDALIAYQKYREFREHQEKLYEAARGATDLSQMRYKAGAASYLEVLTNDTNLFSAELTLARSRLNERLSLVQVYYALGGGWEQ